MSASGEYVDPVDLLASATPPAGWNDVTDLSEDAHAASLLDRVMTGNVVAFRRPRRRLQIVTGVVVAASIGGAAVAAIWEREPDEARALACWSDANNPPDAKVISGWDGVADPIDICATVWTSDDFGGNDVPTRFAACVTDQGVTAVIPGEQSLCTDLGFADYVALDSPDEGAQTLGETLVNIAIATDRLNERYNELTCVEPQIAADGAAAILDELRFEGWTIEIADNFTVDEPCATVFLDSERDVARVVPIARAG